MGIEHLTDKQIGALRDALEYDLSQPDEKDRTRSISAERLLERYGG